MRAKMIFFFAKKFKSTYRPYNVKNLQWIQKKVVRRAKIYARQANFYNRRIQPNGRKQCELGKSFMPIKTSLIWLYEKYIKIVCGNATVS